MPRVLTCIDAVPASDGSCAQAVYLDQPSLLPSMTLAQGREIGDAFLLAVLTVVVLKVFLNPKTHRKIP